MIDIKSFGKRKKTGTTSTVSSGGGYANISAANAQVKGVNIWGQYHDHLSDVDGDLTANGNITSTGTITASQGQINGNLDISGNLTATNGDFGGTITGDDLTLSGDIHCVDINCTNLDCINEVTTEYLTVTKQAHFFNLTIDEIKSVGGQIILSAANATIDHVEQVNGQWLLAWRYEDGDKGINNQFKVNDQVICQTFNQTATNGVNVENKYYWAVVTMIGSDDYTINGETVHCHYIVLDNSQSGFDGQSEPAVGDKICQLGYRGTDDAKRQSAIILSAYKSPDPNVTAPSIVQYEGINSFTLNGCITNQLAHGENVFTGNFKVVNNGTTTDVVDLIQGQHPQVMTDSQQAWAMADSTGKTYYLSDYQNLPTVIQAYLGSEIIPYSEWVTGSQIKYKNATYRLTGTSPAIQPRVGLGISTITRNTNDVTLTWNYTPNALQEINPDTGETTTINSGTTESNNQFEITVKFTHNGTTYTVSKNVPINVIKASETTQGADAEFDRLMIDKLDLTVTLDNKLTCKVNAKVFHVKGNKIEQLTDLSDYTANILLSNNQTVTLTKSTYFYRTSNISSAYTAMTNPPTSATLRLYRNGTLVDEVATPIKFDTGSIFTITENAITSAIQYTDTQLETVNADISRIEQTANSISSRVTNIENDYVTSSELTQTANNIQLNVYDELKNKTGIDISQGQITLNGNTIVNGNLTLSDAEQGFTLIGEGGITQIMPKSIGTYEDFTSITTTTIVKKETVNCQYVNAGAGYFNYRTIYQFTVGKVAAGKTITFLMHPDNYLVNGTQVNETSLSQPTNRTITIYEDGVTMQSGSLQATRYNYTAQGGNITVNILCYRGINTDEFHNGAADIQNVNEQFTLTVTIPNDKFILIGYDGIGLNFGYNKNVYIGEESTTLEYAGYGFRIDATTGIQVKLGNWSRWYSLDEYITMIATGG